MKNLLVLLIALMPASTACAGNERPIGYDELPAAARLFIEQHFPESKVALATVDDPRWKPSYDVVFTDGSKIEFTSSGEWKEIDCRNSPVPRSAVPPGILDFTGQRHPDNYVKEIGRGRRGYEVKLDNGLELRFGRSGEFRSYDD